MLHVLRMGMSPCKGAGLPHSRDHSHVPSCSPPKGSTVQPRLHIVPIYSPALAAHNAKVAAAADGHSADGSQWGLSGPSFAHIWLQHVVPQSEVLQAPCVGRCVPKVGRQHIAPVPLADLQAVGAGCRPAASQGDLPA